MTTPQENIRGKKRKFTNPCYWGGGGGGTPHWEKTNIFPFFSFEGFPYKFVKVPEGINGLVRFWVLFSKFS